MLICTIDNRKCIQNAIAPAKLSELESLKQIVKQLNESQISASSTKYVSFDGLDLKNEDAEAYYITTIKHLVITVESDILNTFYNSTRADFPILKYLLKYSHHSDVMIRNTARISLMNIFQKCQGRTMEYVIFEAIDNHLNDMLMHAKKASFDMQDCYEKTNMKALKMALQYYQEEFEYIDDILKLNSKYKNIIISKIMNDFIAPFILTAIIDDQIEYLSPLCRTIGLLLLSMFLESITDSDLNEHIIKIVLHEKAITIDRKLKSQPIIKNLLLLLLNEKTIIDTLLVLNIFDRFQANILEINTMCLAKLYHKIFFVSMKLLKTNYQSKPFMECLKLKLLISVLQPLTQKNNTYDSDFTKLKDLFFQNLEILYKEIREKIWQNITLAVDIIDEEYEIFTNIKLYGCKGFIDLPSLKDHNAVNKAIDNTKLELYHLFCIRFLHHEATGEKEKCLPIIKKKEEMGKIMHLENSLPCEKFIAENILYHKKHFIKMTDRQLIILQNIKNKMHDGIIIFNAYYKDILWSVKENNSLKLADISNYCSNEFQILSKPFFIHVRFANTDDLQFVTDVINKAKESQIKTVRRKLEKILN